MTKAITQVKLDPQAFGARVMELVERVHGGSVNAAAKATGVPQSTLARITAGKVQRPNAVAVSRLAEFYGTTPEWLLHGEGEPPRQEGESRFAAAFEWQALMRLLKLPPEVHKTMMDFPRMTEQAIYRVMRPNHPRPLSDGSSMVRYRSDGEFEKAIIEERRAWVRLFNDWIVGAGVAHASRLAGLKWVRQQIIDHHELFRSRFAGPPTEKPAPAKKAARAKKVR